MLNTLASSDNYHLLGFFQVCHFCQLLSKDVLITKLGFLKIKARVWLPWLCMSMFIWPKFIAPDLACWSVVALLLCFTWVPNHGHIQSGNDTFVRWVSSCLLMTPLSCLLSYNSRTSCMVPPLVLFHAATAAWRTTTWLTVGSLSKSMNSRTSSHYFSL